MADHTDPGIEKTVGLTVNVLLRGRALQLGRPAVIVVVVVVVVYGPVSLALRDAIIRAPTERRSSIDRPICSLPFRDTYPVNLPSVSTAFIRSLSLSPSTLPIRPRSFVRTMSFNLTAQNRRLYPSVLPISSGLDSLTRRTEEGRMIADLTRGNTQQSVRARSSIYETPTRLENS